MNHVAVDAVVVGAGLAGHCAALAAAEAGARVALLEKTNAPGGSTIISGGSFAFGGTAEQQSLGIDDSPSRLERDLIQVSGGRAEPKLVKAYIDGQFEAHAWLKAHGVVFHRVSLSSNTSVPRTHPTHPRQLIQALHQCATTHQGILYSPDTRAVQLMHSSGDDRVAGIRAHRGQEPIAFAARAVVLATGGFSRNAAMVQRFAPHLRQGAVWGGRGNTGDGISLALELGADLADMDTIAGTFGVAFNRYPDLESQQEDELLLRMAMYRGAIIVNLNAERFADESLSYKKLGALCLQQPRGVAFQIFDRLVMDQSASAPTLNDFQDAYAKGVIRAADSIRELADRVGLDAQKLERTVARYNEHVDQGNDPDFGRRTLGGGFGKPVRIDTPPFYALPCGTALLATYCGLRIDERTRVLRGDGRPIRGLYAAGETVGGFHGAGYMSGSALGKAAIFGLAAGRQACGV